MDSVPTGMVSVRTAGVTASGPTVTAMDSDPIATVSDLTVSATVSDRTVSATVSAPAATDSGPPATAMVNDPTVTATASVRLVTVTAADIGRLEARTVAGREAVRAPRAIDRPRLEAPGGTTAPNVPTDRVDQAAGPRIAEARPTAAESGRTLIEPDRLATKTTERRASGSRAVERTAQVPVAPADTPANAETTATSVPTGAGTAAATRTRAADLRVRVHRAAIRAANGATTATVLAADRRRLAATGVMARAVPTTTTSCGLARADQPAATAMPGTRAADTTKSRNAPVSCSRSARDTTTRSSRRTCRHATCRVRPGSS